MRFFAARKPEFDFIRNFAELTRRSLTAITKALEIFSDRCKKPVALFLGEFLCLLDKKLYTIAEGLKNFKPSSKMTKMKEKTVDPHITIPCYLEYNFCYI